MHQTGRIIRWTASFPCPICGGYEHMARGNGTRCFGFLSPDGAYAHCSREELAGTLPMDGGQTYGHYLLGLCRCGYDHRGGVLTWETTRHERVARSHHGDEVPLWRDAAWKLAATYDYRHADGRVSYRVQRWERKDGTGKTFKQQRYDPLSRSGWRSGLAGVERLPYRLPELARADPRRVILIPEGEKAVDVLCRLGFLATCNSEGAHKGSWHPELAQYFAGRHTVILPDNDAVGRQHAEEVAEALRSVAASIRWLDLPGLPEKGDICDWLDAGGTVAELCRLVRASARWPLLEADRPRTAATGRAAIPFVRQVAHPQRALASMRAEAIWWHHGGHAGG